MTRRTPLRTCLFGAVLSLPAALLCLLLAETVYEVAWAAPVAAAAVVAAAVLGPWYALARQGGLRPGRTRAAVGTAVGFVAAAVAALLVFPDWWALGVAIALVAPVAAFTVLDGSPVEVWARRVATGVLALVPAYLLGFGMTWALFALGPRLDLPLPEVLALFGPGMVVGYALVFVGATLPGAREPADA